MGRGWRWDNWQPAEFLPALLAIQNRRPPNPRWRGRRAEEHRARTDWMADRELPAAQKAVCKRGWNRESNHMRRQSAIMAIRHGLLGAMLQVALITRFRTDRLNRLALGLAAAVFLTGTALRNLLRRGLVKDRRRGAGADHLCPGG